MIAGYNELPFRDLSSEDLRKEFAKTADCTICTDEIVFFKSKIIKTKEDFDGTTEIVSTTCKHFFHRTCLAPWVKEKKKNICPNCNQKTLPKTKKTDLDHLSPRERINAIIIEVREENPDLFQEDVTTPTNVPQPAPESMEDLEEEESQTSERPVSLREKAEGVVRNIRNWKLPRCLNLVNQIRNPYNHF